MPSLSNIWRFHPLATTITSPKHVILALPYMGARCDRTFQAILMFILATTDYFSKWAEPFR